MVDQSSRPPVVVADSQISGIPIPFIYTVYESFWSESELKRVFKVKHLSSDYYYYAFMLDDYIVCPAFLAESLGITNYACINVIYGAFYSYIFVKAEADNPKLDITGDHFDFCGEHVFKLTLKEERVLNLTFENMHLKCFIIFKKFSSKLALEWSEVTRNLNGINGTHEKSKLRPKYFYISSLKLREFKKNHVAFLKKNLYFGPHALIHRDSKSFSEIKETFLI
jgi:hypothetical protein